MSEKRKSYPSDINEEWAFCASYLTLMAEDAPQRGYPLREIFNALRYLVRMGGAWRMMPHDFASMECGLPTDATLDQSRFFRSDGA